LEQEMAAEMDCLREEEKVAKWGYLLECLMGCLKATKMAL